MSKVDALIRKHWPLRRLPASQKVLRDLLDTLRYRLGMTYADQHQRICSALGTEISLGEFEAAMQLLDD